MKQEKTIEGFSKRTKAEKIAWVGETFLPAEPDLSSALTVFEVNDPILQNRLEGFIENAVTNYPLPYGIAPNLLLDGQIYAVPMVIEESSVVAAAAAAFKYWLPRGGFHTQIEQTVKMGQVHFNWAGSVAKLQALLPQLEAAFRLETDSVTTNMRKRGGGLLGLELRDFTAEEPFYYQLLVKFDTCDSMGANFINTMLEALAQLLPRFLADQPTLNSTEQRCEVIMAILSNYTPECVVKAWVEAPIIGSDGVPDRDMELLANKFAKAIRIATIDPYRAVTHNKGIFNGIDSVALATGQDFRAIEACGHAYAARDGQYRSLTSCTINNGMFRFQLELPLAVGVVGGLTSLHPMARRSLDILGQPNARTLMSIIASVGLAQNFAAVRSLITTGIQKGHMKMHLRNILQQLDATPTEIEEVCKRFENQLVSHSAVRECLMTLR
jgi:hydroxymethylglutaryl-CoA reductase